MSEPVGPDDAAHSRSSASPDNASPKPNELYLANLVGDAVTARLGRDGGDKAQWLADHAIDPLTGERPFTKQSAWRLMTKARKSVLDPDQLRAVAQLLFEGNSTFVLDANAIAVGIPIRRSGSFATMLPALVDDLPMGDQMVGRDVLIQLCRARGLIDD